MMYESVSENIEEASVELLLPEHAFGVDTDHTQLSVRTYVHIQELALLGLILEARSSFVLPTD
jgi:hypothetical protein